MATKFQKVKEFYDKGLWNIRRVNDAVGKKWITAKQFTEITGKQHETESEKK